MNSIFIRMNINRIFFNISDHIDFSVVLQIVFHGQCTVGMLDRSWRPRNYYSGISSPRSPEAQSRSLMVSSLKNISFFPLVQNTAVQFQDRVEIARAYISRKVAYGILARKRKKDYAPL